MPHENWAEMRQGGVIYEDDDVLVLDKPHGISVTGERHDTDLVELAGHSGEKLWPVNRIDKVTSGLVLLAKSTKAHGPLTRQFARRDVIKQYLAVVNTVDIPAEHFTIDLPLRTASSGRVRVAGQRDDIVFDSDQRRFSLTQSDGAKNYEAKTAVAVIGRRESGEQAGTTLLAVWPHTGRRHQIRVHLAWIGLPVAGDPLFASTAGEGFSRTHLHAYRLALTVPSASPSSQRFVAPPHSSMGLSEHEQALVGSLPLVP